MTNETELRLQQNCFVWFHNTYPQFRGLFFRIKNEGTNRISGAIGKATGIVPGVSDSILLLPDGMGAQMIEFKTEKGTQSPHQKIWQETITKNLYSYIIIRELTEFQQICKRLLGS